MAKKDYYNTLGIKKDAKADEIKKAYRRLARKHHPDVNPGDKISEDKFKEVQEAYDILSELDWDLRCKSRFDAVDSHGRPEFLHATSTQHDQRSATAHVHATH